MAGVKISGELGNEACALFPLDETRSFTDAVTTANNAFGTETIGFASVAVVVDADGAASDFGELFKGLES